MDTTPIKSTVKLKLNIRKNIVNGLISQKSSFTFPHYVTVDTFNSSRIKPISLDHPINIIWSRMGTFKSVTINELLKHTLPCSSIRITNKRTLAYAEDINAKNNLPFKVYNYLTEDIKGKDHVICQVESLHKVSKTYSMVIIDECTSVLKQFDSGLHGDNLSRNRQMMELLIRDADYIIAMDADVDSRIIEFLHTMRPGDKIHLQHNINKRDGYTVRWYNKELEQDFRKEIIHQALAGKKITIVFGDATELQDMELLLNQYNITNQMYWRDNSINAALSKLKERWNSQGIQKEPTINDLLVTTSVTGYTSVITVGLSFNLEYFDMMFVYGNCNTVCVREIKQMMGRIRNLKDNTIHVFLKTKNFTTQSLPYTYDKVREEAIIKSKYNEETAYVLFTDDELEILSENRTVIYSVKDTIWTRLRFHNKVEDNQSKIFYSELVEHMLKDQGFTIEYVNGPTQYDPGEIKKERKEIRNVRKQGKIKEYDDAPIVEYQEFKNMDQKYQLGMLDKELIPTLEKNKTLQYIQEDFKEDINGIDVYNFQKYKTQVYNARIEINLSIREQMQRDLRNTEKDPRFTQYIYVMLLCDLLGLKGTLDRDTEIPCRVIKKKFGRIVSEYPRFKSIFNIRTKEPPDNFKSLMGVLNTIFIKWSGSTFYAVRTKQRKIHLQDYWNELSNIYGDNVPEFEYIPIFNDKIHKLKGKQHTITQQDYNDVFSSNPKIYIRTYTYNLKPPFDGFDDFVLMSNHINPIYDENKDIIQEDPITGTEIIIENSSACEFKDFLRTYTNDANSYLNILGEEQKNIQDDCSVVYI